MSSRRLPVACALPVLLAVCDGGRPNPKLSAPGDTSTFPPIFEPALWDLDPQIGNAIAGTDFTPDGGRRAGILQLFVFNTLNLAAFIDQQEAQVQSRQTQNTNGSLVLTRISPQARFTQILRTASGQTIHTGSIVFNGATIVSFTHNLQTNAFDGEYTSPADRNTRHRIITTPIKGGFVRGSAYDLLNDGRATYTHVGRFDGGFRPVVLLDFFQVDRPFDEASKDLAARVDAAVNGKAAPNVQTVDAGAANAVDAAPAAVKADFPALLDVRFFQLDVAGAGGPGNSGAIFGVVNAVGRNAVADLQRFIDVSKVTVERDAQGRQVEVRTAAAFGATFESRQTFVKGVQEGVALVDGKKRLQFSRNHDTGAFEGVIIAPSFDLDAPICSIVTPKGNGTSSHLIIEDLANNLKNDYRSELLVDSKSLAPISFTFFQQFNGGLAAQPESAALVRRFGFAGLIRGF
jgi:hypothetical protein